MVQAKIRRKPTRFQKIPLYLKQDLIEGTKLGNRGTIQEAGVAKPG